MKKSSLLLSFLLVLSAGWSTAAMADSSASYTVIGTYDYGALNTSLSAPGQDFIISFTLPTNPASMIQSYLSGDDFYVYPMPVTYSFDGSTTTLDSSLVAFYTSNAGTQSGGFFVAYCATDVTCQTGLEYQWTFAGPRQYTGDESNPALLPVGFSYDGQPFTVYDNFSTEYDSDFSGSVTCGVVSTPEPSALVLLLAGLAGVTLLIKFRS